MAFDSLEYALFLPAVLALYWGLSGIRSRQAILLVASYIFYAAWNVKYLLLIVGSTLLDFYVGKALGESTNRLKRKVLLGVSVSANLGVLALFKYFNFFVTELQGTLAMLGIGWSAPVVNVLLPVGISFYTFQTMSYTIDIYRGHVRPTESLLHFATFVAFFPQLVAGPILRASQFLPELTELRSPDPGRAIDGFHRILRGLLKKALFADLVGARLVDPVFADPATFHGAEVLIAAYGYALQVYGDFSGYSDIAIGSAALLNLHVPENFLHPYRAQSIPELWRRWHISLTDWLRDYLYRPLLGTEPTLGRRLISTFAVFILCGLWHGAGATYIAFGALHGFWVAGANYYNHGRQWSQRPLVVWARRLATFNLWSLSLVIFRATDLNNAYLMLSRLGEWRLPIQLDTGVVCVLAFGLLIHFFHGAWKQRLVDGFLVAPVPLQALVAFLVVTVVSEVSAIAKPFIYFQF